MSGILAVLLATPCSAPFVGTAISFAFTQDVLTIFIVLFFMGLGLAFPYIILVIFPNCIKILPKPGSWMANIKNLMAGFLAATIIWLIYILSNNIGFISSMLIALLSVFMLISLKLCQRFEISKLKEIFILITLIITIFIVPIKISKSFEVKQKTYDKLWVKFDRSKINQLVSEGKTVIVDITADWCITCKLNKALVLNSKAVREKLSKPNIIGMRGDLTRPDSAILDFMSCHNRYAIPFNIVYGPKATNGILLSELLSKRKLLEIIEEAN
jgi:suppressor for copper-sensitivity B